MPENTNVDIVDEFSNIREWADSDGMVINLHKTKEIVLHRPHPSLEKVLNRCSQPNYLELYFKVPSVSLIMLIMFSAYISVKTIRDFHSRSCTLCFKPLYLVV